MGLGDTEQCVAAPAVAVGGERRLARVWAGKEWKSGFIGLEGSGVGGSSLGRRRRLNGAKPEPSNAEAAWRRPAGAVCKARLP